ncbi:hypothetical protein [Pseudomonas poae]|uniref:hypothetical protein n=1 Tax=Pseudomonas poae TaxID=200451 RepID=UPI0016448F40|nr:hypothetical protein [Pseudomonas poae]MBC3198292.1 hypothetical protein [Pseudomonas poae]
MAQSYINDRTTDYESLKSRLMGGGLNRQRSDHFDVLNRHLRPGLVAPGQLVIIPDAGSVSCSGEEAWLMRHAEQVRRSLELNTSAGAVVIGNYGEVRYRFIRGNESLRKVLGISTRSYLHKGEIAGYAKRIREIAQMSKWLGKGTYIGLALDVGVTGLEVREACVTGREAQCRRAKYVETGRFVGGVMGSVFGGHVGAKLSRSVCHMVLGISMKGQGALACAVIGGAAGGYEAGSVLGDESAFLGGKILELNGDLIFEPEGA